MHYDQRQIIEQLQSRTDELVAWFESQPQETFNSGPEEAWTAGQHLHHLIKSAKPLAMGLGIPRIALLFKFGFVKAESRDYEGTVQFYKDGLAKGGVATGQYVPRELKPEEKEQMIQRFQQEMQKLNDAIGKLSDGKLDKTHLPHPLLGKLTIREMLYFTIYHVEHHLNILKERYS